MKWIWYEYAVDERTLSLHNSMIHVKNLQTHLQTWPRLLYCDDSRVRAQSYDCPPHIKYVKHLLYVWSGSGMGSPNHILQHVPSENPTQNPTTGPTPFGVMVWYGVVPLRPPTTYKACQTLSIGMKWIWCEYEVDGRSLSYLTACPQWEPHSKSYDWPNPFWSDGMVWCCTLKATHHI